MRFMTMFKAITENECVDERHPFVKRQQFDQYCTITGKRCERGCKLVVFTNALGEVNFG